MDYYEILEVPRGATDQEIKKAYVAIGLASCLVHLRSQDFVS